MADENKDVNTSGAEDQEQQEAKEPQQPEKKYTDEDVNNISAKNSAKAVNKLMKELGITDKTDRAKVKELIEKSNLNGTNEGSPDPAQSDAIARELEEARAEAQNAKLENILLSLRVKPEKVARAVKLIERAECLDEDGKFDSEKAKTAVTELLKEWPELVAKEENNGVGFSIGSDGQQDASKGKDKKPPVQKSWNRFNY